LIRISRFRMSHAVASGRLGPGDDGSSQLG